MANILITEHIDPSGVALLEHAGHTIVQMETREQSEMVEKLKVADAMLVRILDVSAEAIQNARNLKIISKHGVGVDNIDMEAARAAGVAVTITPGANSVSVAEHTMALLMALAKNLPFTVSQYREIGFAAKNSPPGEEIEGKTLGIIGCGRIGSRLAKMAAFGFDMKVLAYDPYLKEAPVGTELVTVRDRIFREADFVSLHPVLNQETFHCVGDRELRLMKPTAIFLNCGRGPLVDEPALIAALQEGRIAGAGLDVTAKEPCDPESPLFQMSNVLLTPHFAPTTREAATRVSTIAAQNILDFLAGREFPGRLI